MKGTKLTFAVFFIYSPSPNLSSLQHEEGAVDEPNLISDSRLQDNDSNIFNTTPRDGQEVQDVESCGHLEVEVHQQVSVFETQNTKEGNDISILDEQTQLHDNTRDTNANGVGYIVSQASTATDKSQPNHVASNKKLATFFFWEACYSLKKMYVVI